MAVDFLAYATLAARPEDLSAVPHPRIGYVGYIKKQLNWPLIFKIANPGPLSLSAQGANTMKYFH
jgi:hypothetical protein